MDFLHTFRTVRAVAAHIVAGITIALVMAQATSRLSAPPATPKHHTAAFTHSALDRCTSRPWQETEGCGQCAHFLSRDIVRDEDAWLLVTYVSRGHVIPNRRLRGRSRYSKSRQLPHEYFLGAMEEALEAIGEAEPGAKVNIAVLSEGHVGGMVDELGAPVSWSVLHDYCDSAGLECAKTEVMLYESRSMEDAVRCMASADIFIGSDDEFSRDASRISSNVRVVTSQDPLAEEGVIVLRPGSVVVGGLSHSERAEFRDVVRQWRECSLATKDLMLA